MTEVGLWPLCPLGLSHTPRPTPLSTVTPTKVAPPCSLSTHTHTDHPGNPGAWRSCQQQDQTQKDSLPFRQERLESSEASKLCRGTAAPREGPFWQRGAQGPRVANTSERRLGGRVPAAPLTGHLTHSGLAEDQRTRALPSQLHHGFSAGGTNTAVPWLGALTQPLPWFHKASATP